MRKAFLRLSQYIFNNCEGFSIMDCLNDEVEYIWLTQKLYFRYL